MPERTAPGRAPGGTLAPWALAAAVGLPWAGALTIALVYRDSPWPALAAGLASAALTAVEVAVYERRRWVEPVARLAGQVNALTQDPASGARFEAGASVAGLARSLDKLAGAVAGSGRGAPAKARAFVPPGDSATFGLKQVLTRSGLFDSTADVAVAGSADCDSDPGASRDFSTTDMVNRLDPRLFRWLESSAAEQQFLGWPVARLREKSFLEVVLPEDVGRAREGLNSALVKGETHGLLLRVKTAQGRLRAVVVNVSTRYGRDTAVSHLRCHVTDVTAKVRAEKELRNRTRELTLVNERLRVINRELEDLKDRYRDLYQNAPAMYFDLDARGAVLECNDTLLRALGYRRDAVVGRSFANLLTPDRRAAFAARYGSKTDGGPIEVESQWLKANGEVIDVYITGESYPGADGRPVRARGVAQDVTARNRLEAELQEKNERLARTIDELSRRNKEMDEFTYVVSHDLQEPLRTLNAFSDFLLRDCGDKIDAEGQESIHYIVDASRRMRALIHDLLALSRAGKVTAEFAAVDLGGVVQVVRADLAELVRTKNAEVVVHPPLPGVWGDRQRIGQLLANLVANGLKYNDKLAPRVEIGALPAEGTGPVARVTVFVRDNGIGIDPQFHSKIFQLFRRLHAREEYEGNGAGLAICEKIARAHGGRVWVESEPNRGSTFFVTLPSTEAAGAPAAPEAAADDASQTEPGSEAEVSHVH